MKKVTTLVAILVIVFAVNALKAQTYPVPQFYLHITGGYTYCLPDLKGDYPADIQSGKNPTPYFIKNGFNFGADGKYFIDKKRTFGLIASLTYSMLSSGNIAVSDAALGVGTFNTKMNIFTLGLGAEYDFAPKRPANPFVNFQVITNMFGGKTTFSSTGGTLGTQNVNSDLSSAVRFGAMFEAGVDVKLSKKIGVVIGGRYAFANLLGKAYTADSTTSNYNLNDKENGDQKSRKIAYLQFYAGISFYFGQPIITPKK